MYASVIHTLKPTVVLDGKAIAGDYCELLQRQLTQLKKATLQLQPLTLATFRVGDAKDALFYSKSIAQLLSKLDIRHQEFTFAENSEERDIVNKITAANSDPSIHGILVFAPIPARFHQPNLINAISPEKDVEGRGILTGFSERIVSPTANAVITLIEAAQTDIAGKHAVIIGHSDLVGKPVSILLLDRYATVTVCHHKTKDLEAQVRKADIVVSAAGKAALIKGKWIKPGAIVIDVGENVVNGRVTGDVEFDVASRRASYITPVPGGVGPVTNVMLVRNLLKLREIQDKRHALAQGRK
jgi:methylenetetrahydrofolate dehydrogenase (NADP+)/methenyltetrahydrofolate cyclohydrolase